MVMPTGELIRIGGKSADAPGYDLCGLFVGSEGTLALVTEITVRLTRLPEAVKTLLAIYDRVDDATETVVEITARGITPAACEMLDGWTLRAVEAWVHAGFPLDSAAVLLIEVEGLREAVEAAGRGDRRSLQPARRARSSRGARCRGTRPALERPQKRLRRGRPPVAHLLRAGRRDPAHQAAANLARNRAHRQREWLRDRQYFSRRRRQSAPDYSVRRARPEAVSSAPFPPPDAIIRFCVEMGGTITGEHGVGMEKDRLMPLLFSEADLALMRRVRDAFNPDGLLNPGKIFPTGKGCGEVRVRPASRRLPDTDAAKAARNPA